MATDTREMGVDPTHLSKKPQRISQALTKTGWRTQEPGKSETQSTSSTIENCPRCQGAGWLRYDVEYGHPDFGRIEPCPCNWDRVNEARMQKAFDRAAIPVLYRGARIDQFNDGIVIAVQNAIIEGKAIWIYGKTGTGKTHLAVGILKDALDRREDAIFISLADLIERIKGRFNDQSQQDPFEAGSQVETLVLDDIAAERPTEFALDVFSRLVDYRYSWAKRTIFTSNASPVTLTDHFGPRIASRVMDMCRVIHLDGRDRRAQK